MIFCAVKLHKKSSGTPHKTHGFKLRTRHWTEEYITTHERILTRDRSHFPQNPMLQKNMYRTN